MKPYVIGFSSRACYYIRRVFVRTDSRKISASLRTSPLQTPQAQRILILLRVILYFSLCPVPLGEVVYPYQQQEPIKLSIFGRAYQQHSKSVELQEGVVLRKILGNTSMEK
jgi:hypothetical protein